MPDRDWRFRVQDILESMEKILSYTAGMTFEEFKRDDKTVDAVIRKFTVIGEAARHIPKQIEDRHPDLPWNEMRGMRHILVHEYFGVSLPTVWHTIQNDLPPLLPKLRAVLNVEESNEGKH
jgi:uncharacterized protein with HEPN domain